MRTRRLLISLSLSLAACGPSIDLSSDEYATTSQDLVVCAAGPVVQGIDVSVYQGTINWAQVHAAGKQFAIARIGDGLGHDTTFPGHWAAIKANGMIRGSYQFFRPNLDPIAQANIVIAAVGRLGPGDLPVVLDVEAPGTLPTPAVYNARIHAWVDKVEAGTGKKPIIYTGKYYWPNVNTGDFASYPLWHAQYTTAPCPNISNFWSSWKLWQYRGGPVSGIPGGTCPGISGSVDLDSFNGSLADLKAFAGQQTCTPHCEGAVMVDAACGRGDCAAFGSTCAKDSLGLRCVFAACPAMGDTDVCTDDTHVAHCHNGALATPGDCGAYAARCSTANAPTGARCVSNFCASSMTEVPQPSEGCWPQSPARIATCDANGGFTFTACAAGEQCSIVGGVHCEPQTCPATGTADICDGDVVAHCVEGQVVSAVDCDMSSARCSPAGGMAKCVSRACVPTGSSVPMAHTTCLPSGWLATCGDDGLISKAEPCADGLTCTDGTCVPPVMEQQPDAGSAMGGGGEVDAGMPEMPPVKGAGCGCTESSSGLFFVLSLLLVSRSRARAG